MAELVVRLPQPLYRRLLKRTAIEKREPNEVIVEAVEYWLREDTSDEARIERALRRTGLLVPPEEKRYAMGRAIDREALRRKLAKIRLDPPLSEDIIADRR